MRNSKKAILASVSFLLCVILISGSLIGLYYHGNVYAFEDAGARRDLADSLDFIFIGASHGQAAFIPEQFDAIVGCSSYNLSGSMMPIHARKVLIEKEIERNPIKTVVLEISYDALERDQQKVASTEGDAYVLARLDSPLERASYIASYIPFDNLDYCYATSMLMGLVGARNIVTHDLAKPASDNKGFIGAKSNDISLSPEQLDSHNTSSLGPARDENLKEIHEIIQLCKQHNIQIIIVFSPVSNSLLYRTSNEDEIYDAFCAFCTDNDCPVINFDLYKDRFDLFNDATSFEDDYHLSEEGAAAFTNAMAITFRSLAEENDISSLFFDSYSEMEVFSPYFSK